MLPRSRRPSWCRPLADFRGPRWGGLFAFNYWGRGFNGGFDGRGWRGDDCRPVVVKVVNVRTPVHHETRLIAQETARQKAMRLASRNAGDEQRRQREAAMAQRRTEVEQRRVYLAGFGSQAGSQGAAAIAIKQANAADRETRRQATEAERANRSAATQAERERGSEAKRAVEAHADELRLRTQAEAREWRTAQSDDSVRAGVMTVRPTRAGSLDATDGRRLRWAERRELDQRQREQRANLAVATGQPPQVVTQLRPDDYRGDDKRDARQLAGFEIEIGG